MNLNISKDFKDESAIQESSNVNINQLIYFYSDIILFSYCNY